jgi:hypothetical protein
VSIKDWWHDMVREISMYAERKLFQCHYIYHKSHMHAVAFPEICLRGVTPGIFLGVQQVQLGLRAEITGIWGW